MSCACGKLCYDKKEANRTRNTLREYGRARMLDVYPCKQHGGCYHLTHAKYTGFDKEGRRFRK